MNGMKDTYFVSKNTYYKILLHFNGVFVYFIGFFVR